MKFYPLIIACLFAVNAFATETIKVGIYDFPPYAFVGEDTKGIAVQMITEMNKFQSDYKFIPVPTTSKRRYRDFEQKKFDMIIFENKEWGWQDYPIDASKNFVTGFEVYVAQALAGRDQDFFTDFKSKAMIGVLGYHYRFANFSTDQEYLVNNFNLLQTSGQKKSLELILKGRGDIAVLTKEYLNYHFLTSPTDRTKLLISKKFDQIYRHTILIRKNHQLSVQYINQLLANMKQKGVLTPLWNKYGLEVAP